jgi:molybdopterin/thiamine biosynthesis adenylyltransferase
MTKPSILFVGTGNMGNPIAANLLRAGYALSLADLDETKFANLLLLGGYCLAQLLDNSVHVSALAFKFRNDICLSLLKEDAIHKSPAFSAFFKLT